MKLICLVLFALLMVTGCPKQVSAQVPVTLSLVAKQQFFSASGSPLANGCLFTYNSGTSTPAATYTDSTGLFTAPNPIILDGGGFASIWLAAQSYRFVLFTAGGTNCATGTQQWVIDGVNPPPFLGGNNAWTGANSFSGTTTFNGSAVMNAGGSMTGTFSGNPVFSGNPTFSGNPSFTGGLSANYFASNCLPTATAGFLRLCSTDAVDWRNNANSANVGLSKNGSDEFTLGGPLAVQGILNSTGYQFNGLPSFIYLDQDFTTANNTNFQAITGNVNSLTWTFPANTAMVMPFSCHLVYQQNTGNAVVSFGIQDATVAPTFLTATGFQQIDVDTSNTIQSGVAVQAVNSSLTSAQEVMAALPVATGTNYFADMNGIISQPSNASTSNVTILVKTNTGADAVTIKAQSFCRLN